MNKVKCTYTLPGGTLRLLDPDHFYETLDGQNIISSLVPELEAYRESFPNKVQWDETTSTDEALP